MIWWINQPTRALSEKADIIALAERVPWLKVNGWRFDEFPHLAADIEIVADGKPIGLTLVYPELFPEFPARVVTKDGVLLSAHQYGAKGELCLEWRADNWRPDVTGAMLIESAHRLLSSEIEQAKPVESAHDITLGQRIRTTTLRFILPDDVRQFACELPADSRTPIRLVERYFGETYILGLTAIGESETPAWERRPRVKFGNIKRAGILIRQAVPEGFSEKAAVEALLGESFGEWVKANPSKNLFLAFADTARVRLFELCDPANDGKLLPYQTVDLPPEHSRLPAHYDALGGKTVGIVGCGSVGSKVAVSLARAGIEQFTLVDSDIVMPGNVVRNELDARAIGVNKTEALRQAILEINSAAKVELSEILLGRQESAAYSAQTAVKLGKCDVVVDATADINAFLTCAAIAQAYKKPLIWGRVYEGGLGGLVARARPDADPVPTAARRQIDGWFQKHGIPWKSSAESRNYEGSDDGVPLVATDAEVGLVAMHMVRFVTDALTDPTGEAFPSSAYAVGFSKRWIFREPFDVWPIDLVAEGTWGAATEENKDEKLKELVDELFPDTEEKSAG